MPGSAAATTLVLAMIVATVGTIFQADVIAASCGSQPCPTAIYGTAAASDSWEASLRHALHRTERGLQQMAGLPASR